MKRRTLTVFASLMCAVSLSLWPAMCAMAEPASIICQTEYISLSEYMKGVYKTTESPELDTYVFQAFKLIEDNKYSRSSIVVYSGDYDSCKIFREYFNYAYGFTYDIRLSAYRTSGSSNYVVALCNTDNLDQKIATYLSEVKKAQGIAERLAGSDAATTVNNIFNWAKANMRYDYSLLSKEDSDETFKSYYGFYDGKATLCKGYSMAVYQLCSMNGIPTTLETGTFNGYAHAWNTATIDGSVKYVDVLNEQNAISSQLPSAYVPDVK